MKSTIKQTLKPVAIRYWPNQQQSRGGGEEENKMNIKDVKISIEDGDRDLFHTLEKSSAACRALKLYLASGIFFSLMMLIGVIESGIRNDKDVGKPQVVAVMSVIVGWFGAYLVMIWYLSKKRVNDVVNCFKLSLSFKHL